MCCLTSVAEPRVPLSQEPLVEMEIEIARSHDGGNLTRTLIALARHAPEVAEAPGGCLDGASRQSATIENAVSGHSCVGFGDRTEPDARRAPLASAVARVSEDPNEDQWGITAARTLTLFNSCSLLCALLNV